MGSQLPRLLAIEEKRGIYCDVCNLAYSWLMSKLETDIYSFFIKKLVGTNLKFIL